MFEDTIVRLCAETPLVTDAARNSAYEQATKVKEEAEEIAFAAVMDNDFNTIEECIDTIFATVQVLKRYESTCVWKVASFVMRKNMDRGYFDVREPEDGREGR